MRPRGKGSRGPYNKDSDHAQTIRIAIAMARGLDCACCGLPGERATITDRQGQRWMVLCDPCFAVKRGRLANDGVRLERMAA